MPITNEEIYGELKELRHEVQDGFARLGDRQTQSETEIAALKECTVSLRRDVDKNTLIDKVTALVSAAIAGVTAVFIGKS